MSLPIPTSLPDPIPHRPRVVSPVRRVLVPNLRSTKDRIRTLRWIYSLPDAHIVPTCADNHLVCRLDPNCNWINKFRDGERAHAPALFAEHVREHVRTEARTMRALNYDPASMRSVIPRAVGAPRTSSFPNAISVHRCGWRDCGGAFYDEERLIEHVVREHLHLSVGAYCPVCATLLAVQVQVTESDADLYGPSTSTRNNPQDMVPIIFTVIGGPTRRAMIPRDAVLGNSSLNACYPLMDMLQCILLDHYEAGRCEALEEVRLSTLEEGQVARIEDWRSKTTVRD